MIEADIARLLTQRHKDGFCLPQCKVGVGGQVYTDRDREARLRGLRRPGESTGEERIDFWALRRIRQVETIAYEIKCSRGDFFGDRKYPSYWLYCNLFYFAIPNKLITREEMSRFAPQCGFIEATANGQRMRIVRQPVRMNEKGIEQSIFHHILMWRVVGTRELREREEKTDG